MQTANFVLFSIAVVLCVHRQFEHLILWPVSETSVEEQRFTVCINHCGQPFVTSMYSPRHMCPCEHMDGSYIDDVTYVMHLAQHATSVLVLPHLHGNQLQHLYTLCTVE